MSNPGQRVRWYDGQTARAHDGCARLDGAQLWLEGDGPALVVEVATLVDGGRDTREWRLHSRAVDGPRLSLYSPFDPELVARLGRPARAPVGAGVIAAGVGVTALLAGLLATVIAPSQVARLLPMSAERRLGAIYDLPIEWRACTDPASQRTLDRMVDRLDPVARRDGITIKLLHADEANAAALPGQRIVVLDGMFALLPGPGGKGVSGDALAGVLAHELAHVRRRHVAAAIVRSLGIGSVIALAGGGQWAGVGGNLVSLKFTRDAEAEADADALAMLDRAGIDPRPTAALFDRFARDAGSTLPGWANSHPPSRARARQFRDAYVAGRSYRAAVPSTETLSAPDVCD